MLRIGGFLTLSAVTRGGATQSELYAKGLVEVPWCLLCGQRGTDIHRHFCCPGFRAERRDCPATLQQRGRVALGDPLLWGRALTADPSASWAFVPAAASTFRHCSEQISQDESSLSGVVAVDGSRKWKWRGGGALGWAAVSVDDKGVPLVTLWGVVPVSLPIQAKTLELNCGRSFLRSGRRCLPLPCKRLVPPLLGESLVASFGVVVPVVLARICGYRFGGA